MIVAPLGGVCGGDARSPGRGQLLDDDLPAGRDRQRGDGLRTIGVGYVETAGGQNALDNALALARRSGAKLRVLSAAKQRPVTGTFGGGDALTPATR
jgi:hypothetical protein